MNAPARMIEVSAEERAQWSTAVPDWRERIKKRLSLVPKLPLYDAEAERALRIFKRLRVPDLTPAPGEELPPTYGEVCDEWVFDFVRVVFGSFDPERKIRLLQDFFLLVPKKNGKSAIAAAIILVAAIMNERPRALLLLLAPTIEIAKIAFEQCEGIIRLDPELDKLFHCKGNNIRTIENRISKAVIAIKGADTDTVTGGKPTYILIDETHEFARKSNASAVFLEARGGLASRQDGFLLQISTQSKKQPGGVFAAELDRARAVRDGEIEGLNALAVIYELPEDLATKWRDRRTWRMVNPNLGRSVSSDFLEARLIAAERDGKAALALFASQHFNVEIGVGLKGDSWVGGNYWAQSTARNVRTLDELLELSEVAVVGIDGGGLDDLLGLCVTGRLPSPGVDPKTGKPLPKRWISWFYAWAQSDVLERRKEIVGDLTTFAEAGDVSILEPDRPHADLEELVEIVQKVAEAGLLPEKKAIGLDPAGVMAIVDALGSAGISDEQMIGIGQGYRLSPAIWGMERKLKNGTYLHCGQPLMNWVLGNAKTEQRGSAVVVTKEAAGKAKIDPLVAGFNAFQLMAANPKAARSSYLGRRALVVA